MTVALVVRRKIRARVERVFDAWTSPAELRAWWGPRPVTCADAEVDLRVGGHYRIVNALPDDGAPSTSLVTVRFEAHGDETEVVVVHENISDEARRDSHEKGWNGCLDGLARELEAGI
ncbi:MAG: SRPBCC family protein [Polyangiaceae bacterium]